MWNKQAEIGESVASQVCEMVGGLDGFVFTLVVRLARLALLEVLNWRP